MNINALSLYSHNTTYSVLESNIKPLNDQMTSEVNLKQPILTKEVDIQQKNGQIWACIDRLDDPETGQHSYLFEINKRYNFLQDKNAQANFKEKIKDMFPAIEIPPISLLFLKPNSTLQDLVNIVYKEHIQRLSVPYCEEVELKYIYQLTKASSGKFYEFASTFNKLGFEAIIKEDGTFQLKLPSKENLLTRWAKLKEENLFLPSLSIDSNDGVADSRQFIDAFLKVDLLISEKEEFFHDLIIHGIPTLMQMMCKKRHREYQNEKSVLRSKIQQGLMDISTINTMIQNGSPLPDRIKNNLLILTDVFSAIIDIWTGSTNPEKLGPAFFENFLNKDSWEHPDWKRYWSHYPNIDFNALTDIWKDIQEVIKQEKTKKLEDLKNKFNSIMDKPELTLEEMLEAQYTLTLKGGLEKSIYLNYSNL